MCRDFTTRRATLQPSELRLQLRKCKRHAHTHIFAITTQGSMSNTRTPDMLPSGVHDPFFSQALSRVALRQPENSQSCKYNLLEIVDCRLHRILISTGLSRWGLDQRSSPLFASPRSLASKHLTGLDLLALPSIAHDRHAATSLLHLKHSDSMDTPTNELWQTKPQDCQE